MAGGSRSTTVVPVRRLRSCALPTRTPARAVRVRLTFAMECSGRRPGARYLTAGPPAPSPCDLLDRELHAAGLDFREDVPGCELLGREDARARDLLLVDEHRPGARDRRREEALR